MLSQLRSNKITNIKKNRSLFFEIGKIDFFGKDVTAFTLLRWTTNLQSYVEWWTVSEMRQLTGSDYLDNWSFWNKKETHETKRKTEKKRFLR